MSISTSRTFVDLDLAQKLRLEPIARIGTRGVVITGGHRCSLERLKEEPIMLVLSRKLGQSFHVGPEIRVTVIKIDRNSIRIGIDAPEDISIQREEIVFELPQERELEVETA